MFKAWIVAAMSLMMFEPSFQNIHDLSFVNYCKNRAKGELTIPSPSNSKPTGSSCKFILELPTKDNEEAKEHCKRWAIHHVSSARKHNVYTECTVVNTYQCRDAYVQIRGMCYRKMAKREVTFDEAQKICQDDNAQILKLPSMMFGEVLEDQYEYLTKYFIESDDEYERWVTFSGGTGPNYVVLFNDAYAHKTGANGIKRFKATSKADVMCMYRPAETVASIDAKAQKLAPYYYATALTHDMSVWRSAGLYTRTNLPNHDVCQASLKAVIGSTEGTIMEMSPVETNQLSSQFRASFVQAYAPFSDCALRSNAYRVFFQNKNTVSAASCSAWPPISDDYKANFHTDQTRDNPFSYVFYSELSNGHQIEGRRAAIHGPMLCGLVHVPQVIPRFKCPEGWLLFPRSRDEYICHRFEFPDRQFDEAERICKTMGAIISTWRSVAEFEFILELSNAPSNCPRPLCGPYVACINVGGCVELQKNGNNRPFMGTQTTGWCSKRSWGHSVCEKPATPI